MSLLSKSLSTIYGGMKHFVLVMDLAIDFSSPSIIFFSLLSGSVSNSFLRMKMFLFKTHSFQMVLNVFINNFALSFLDSITAVI